VSTPNVFTLSAEKLEGIRGVHIGPGATAFTLIPLSIKDNDKDSEDKSFMLNYKTTKKITKIKKVYLSY